MDRSNTQITRTTMLEVRTIIYRTAEQYDIPPVHITAHIRSHAADQARQDVYRALVADLGFSRASVARIFNRSLRRVRKSVIGV